MAGRINSACVIIMITTPRVLRGTQLHWYIVISLGLLLHNNHVALMAHCLSQVHNPFTKISYGADMGAIPHLSSF